MFHATRRVIIGLVLIGYFSWSTEVAGAGTKPSLKVIPQKARIGATATVAGRGFVARQFYTVLFTPRGGLKSRQSKFLGIFLADSSGAFRASVKLPVVSHCGTASLLALSSRGSALARTRITITGCKISGSVKVPPPPPTPVKKKP